LNVLVSLKVGSGDEIGLNVDDLNSSIFSGDYFEICLGCIKES
jgi:hypothetical protein